MNFLNMFRMNGTKSYRIPGADDASQGIQLTGKQRRALERQYGQGSTKENLIARQQHATKNMDLHFPGQYSPAETKSRVTGAFQKEYTPVQFGTKDDSYSRFGGYSTTSLNTSSSSSTHRSYNQTYE